MSRAQRHHRHQTTKETRTRNGMALRVIRAFAARRCGGIRKAIMRDLW
jgi:hypothetical protein